MFDPQTAALLRAVLDELCENAPQQKPRHELALLPGSWRLPLKGEWSIDELKEVGREALHEAPTM